MASRGSAARRLPGNPVGGMLRELNRRARQSAKAGPRGHEGPEGPPGPPGPPGAAGRPLAAAVAVTGGDGRAEWVFTDPLAAPPVIAALPVDPDPGDERTVTVTLEQTTTERVVVRVWRTRPLLGLGLLPAEPAGAGVRVHLTATPTT
ncbi:hypothetical protein ACFOWE_18315 [Planomonospora corallina]|uniref:Collagen triple helix repeat-containing protein n=1 Tax=Planomonospora corallina TaxID=1806052 RepID=A0ABV8IB18_9ACTN